MKNIITNVVSKINGKKSYTVSVIAGAYTLLQAFNVIVTTPQQDVAVYALLTALFGVTIRHAIK